MCDAAGIYPGSTALPQKQKTFPFRNSRTIRKETTWEEKKRFEDVVVVVMVLARKKKKKNVMM